MGQAPRARAQFQQLATTFPQTAEVWLGLGNLSLACQDLESARQAYTRALQLQPQNAGLWLNLGQLELQAGHLEAAETALRQALTQDPSLEVAALTLARLLLGQYRLKAAESVLQNALNIRESPDLAWLYSRLLQLTHRCEEARNWSQRALEHLPPASIQSPSQRFRSLQALLDNPERLFLDSAQAQQAWAMETLTRLESWHAHGPCDLRQCSSELPFLPETFWSLNYLKGLPPELHLQLNQSLARCFSSLPPPPGKTGAGPLRVGFLVSRGHEGIFKMQQGGLLMLLPPEAITPVLIGSQQHLQDCEHPSLERLELAPDLFQAAQHIRSLKLDLLYYWEIGSDLLNYFLPFLAPAPVQLTSWGTPSSTGQPHVQAFFSPAYGQLGGQLGAFSETLYPLASLPGYFQDAASLAEPRERESLKQELEQRFQLPPTAPILLCLQNPLKYSPLFLNLLQKLLERQPQAHLCLLCSDLPWIQNKVQHAVNQALQNSHRIHWLSTPMPRSRYLNLIALATLILDTPGFSGCQSHLDALAMGRPVLTLPGQTLRSRFSTHLYCDLLAGVSQPAPETLEALIVSSPEAYLQSAEKWLTQPDWRAEVHTQLKAQRQRLFDQNNGVTAFTQALWQLAEQFGLRPPSSFPLKVKVV